MPWAMFNPCNPCCRNPSSLPYITSQNFIAMTVSPVIGEPDNVLLYASSVNIIFLFPRDVAPNDGGSSDNKGKFIFNRQVQIEYKIPKAELYQGLSPAQMDANFITGVRLIITSTVWVDDYLYLNLYLHGAFGAVSELSSFKTTINDWMFPVFKIRMDLNKVNREWFKQSEVFDLGGPSTTDVGFSGAFPGFAFIGATPFMEFAFAVPLVAQITNSFAPAWANYISHMSWSDYDSTFYFTLGMQRSNGALQRFPDWVVTDKTGNLLDAVTTNIDRPLGGGSLAVYDTNTIMKCDGDNNLFPIPLGYRWSGVDGIAIGDLDVPIRNLNYRLGTGNVFYPIDISEKVVAFSLLINAAPGDPKHLDITPMLSNAMIVGVDKSVFTIGSYNKQYIATDDIFFVLPYGSVGGAGIGAWGFSSQHHDYSSP